MNDQELRDFAGDVAKELTAMENGDGGWLRNDYPGDDIRGIVVDGPEGASIQFRMDYAKKGKLTITGRHIGRHEITVAPTRSAFSIAGAVRSKLLPAYLADIRQHKEDVAEAMRDREARESFMSQVAEMLGSRVTTDSTSATASLVKLAGTVYGEVTAQRDASTVEVRARAVPRDLALRLVAVLADYREPVTES